MENPSNKRFRWIMALTTVGTLKSVAYWHGRDILWARDWIVYGLVRLGRGIAKCCMSCWLGRKWGKWREGRDARKRAGVRWWEQSSFPW